MSMPRGKLTATRKPRGTRAGTTVPLSSIVGFSSGEPSLLPREPLDMDDFTIDNDGKLFYAARVTDGSGDINNTLLNVFEFPPLAAGASPRPHSSALQIQQYGTIVKQPRKEFHMSQNDFPPLPNALADAQNDQSSSDDHGFNMTASDFDQPPMQLQNTATSLPQLPTLNCDVDAEKLGELMGACALNDSSSILTVSDDTHTNAYTADESATAPESFDGYSSDQFTYNDHSNVLPPNDYGLLGLLPLLRAPDTCPAQTMLTIGFDFEDLGVDFNTQTPLYERFLTPLSDRPLAPQGSDGLIPEEYRVNAALSDKLEPLNLENTPEDTIFYIFYNITNDLLQLQAAEQLYIRSWRFHKEMRVWISRVCGGKYEKFGRFVTGQFIIFDQVEWKKVYKEMEINLDKLEERQVPENYRRNTNVQYNPFNLNCQFDPNLQGNIDPAFGTPCTAAHGAPRLPPGFTILDYDFCQELDNLLRDQRDSAERQKLASTTAATPSDEMSASKNPSTQTP